MNRNYLLWFGATALLLMFGAWLYTVCSATVRPMRVLSSVVTPMVFLIACSGVFWAGWRKGLSGLFVLGSLLLGIALVGFAQWFALYVPSRLAGWLLLPTFCGLGILVENHLGIGWRFSNRQGFWMIAAGLIMFIITLCFFIDFNSSSGSVNRILNLPRFPFDYHTVINLDPLNLFGIVNK